jgi:hypothetical protein
MPDLSSMAMKEMAETFLTNSEGYDPAVNVEDFCLDKVDYEYVGQCTNKRELAWIIRALEDDKGFPHLLEFTRKTLYEMDPSM